MIQLSLFPVRGFVVALPGGYLAHDHQFDRPAFYRTRRAARKDSAVAYWKHGTVIPAELHDEETYIIGASR